MYYRCVEVVDGACTTWVQHQDLLDLPEGAGLQIGGMLLLLSSVAWGIQHIARLLLNR